MNGESCRVQIFLWCVFMGKVRVVLRVREELVLLLILILMGVYFLGFGSWMGLGYSIKKEIFTATINTGLIAPLKFYFYKKTLYLYCTFPLLVGYVRCELIIRITF